MPEYPEEYHDWLIRARQIEKSLDDYLSHLASAKARRFTPVAATWTPSVDIHETTESLIVLADVGGVAVEELEAVVEGRQMVLSGQRRAAVESQARCHQIEIPQGPFQRTIDLPSLVVATKADARMANGLLRIVFPKSLTPTHARIRIKRHTTRARRQSGG